MNDLLPAPPERDLSDLTKTAIRNALVAQIRTIEVRPSHRSDRPSGRPHQRRRRAMAMAAVVLALVIAVPIAFSGHGGGAPSASANDVLMRAARSAALQPPISVGPGQFLRRSTISMHRITQGRFPLLVTLARQTFTSASGRGSIDEQLVHVGFESAAERVAWEASGQQIRYWGNFSMLGPNGEPSVCPQIHLTVHSLDTLPSDPDALERVLRQRIILGDIADASQAIQTQTMSDEIGTMLMSDPGSPAERSALFQVLARQPGIQLLGPMTDHVGRSGTGIGITSNGVRAETIVDPSTGQVLEFRTVQVDSKGSLGDGVDGTPPPNVGVNADGVDQPGTVLGWSTQLRLDVVDALPQMEGACAGISLPR